jgi:hypothetical protein
VLTIVFAGCGSTSKEEELLDTLLLVARNILQFCRLAAVMRQYVPPLSSDRNRILSNSLTLIFLGQGNLSSPARSQLTYLLRAEPALVWTLISQMTRRRLYPVHERGTRFCSMQNSNSNNVPHRP